MATVILGNVACSGNSDDNGGGGDDPVLESTSFTLQVDKTTIEADGKDFATFTILDDKGRDVTSEVVRNTSFTNLTTDTRLDYGTNKFTSIIDGEYTFKATVATSKSVTDTENTVTIKVQNRSLYEKYKQHVGIYKMTGTWCGYCPDMTKALHAVREDLQDNMIVVELHNTDPFSVAMGGGFDMVSYIGLVMNLSNIGLPSNIYKARDLNGSRSSKQIEGIIENYMLETPATCGVKIASAERDGETITVNAALTTTRAGKYDLGCFLLLDNQYYTGGTEPSNIYNNIVISTTMNYTGVLSQDYYMMQPDVEQTHTFTIPNVSSNYSTNDLRVVVFALTELEGSTIMDNCQVCPVGGSADYELN